MENDILISVIVPVYNVEKYLERCVDSIRTQTYSNLEIILVDDGSPDGSGAICDAYAAKDSRVRVIHKENGGLSSARNAGMDMAAGEYLSFIDSDDWIHPDTYAHLMELLKKYDASIACMGNMDVSEKTGEQKLALCPKKEECISGEELVQRMFLWQGIDCAACDKVFRSELFRDIRFPLGKTCEDIAIMYRVVLPAQRVVMCDKPYYYYFHRPGSISYSGISDKSFHFMEHTGEILKTVCRDYPNLETCARYLRIRSLIHSVQITDLASPEDRRKYRTVCAAARKELRHNISFILQSGLFSRKEILTNVLMAMDLYRAFRRVYHIGR